MVGRMPHGQLITRPILVLPTEVAQDLVSEAVARPSPNPLQFAAGEWWRGALFVLGVTADAVTLVQGREALRHVAGRLCQWLRANPPKDDHGKRLLSYRTPQGRMLLKLDSKPQRQVVEAFMEVAYRALEDDIGDESA